MSDEPGILVIRYEDDLEKLKLRNFYEIHITGNNSKYPMTVLDRVRPYIKYVSLIGHVTCDIWALDLYEFPRDCVIIFDEPYINGSTSWLIPNSKYELLPGSAQAELSDRYLRPEEYSGTFDVYNFDDVIKAIDRSERRYYDKRKLFHFTSNLNWIDITFNYI